MPQQQIVILINGEQPAVKLDLAASCLKGRTRVLIGVSRMVPSETIELANYAVSKGLTEVMVVSPYYFKLDENALEKYYDEVAEGTDARIFLYNFPDRTVHDLSPELVLRLARKHKNVVGIKDTVTVMSHTSAILTAVKPPPRISLLRCLRTCVLRHAVEG